MFKKMNLAYRISLWCGLTPLFTGTTIFLTWLIIRQDWLQFAGIYTIYAGLILFCAGLISLIIYFIKARSIKTERYWEKIIISSGILLANFPVAGLIIAAVIYIMDVSLITIENNSNYTIENIYLSDPLHKYEIGSVSPHNRISKEIHFKTEGSVDYTFKMNDTEYNGIIIEYVTFGLSSSASMIITESGEVKIHEFRNLD